MNKKQIETLKNTNDDDLLSVFPGYKRALLRRVKREVLKKQLPKILIFDIETAPMEVYVWNCAEQRIHIGQIIKDWFILSWSAKWLFEPEIIHNVINPKEVKTGNDKRIVKHLWKLLNEADIIMAHNCVSINTPVLTQDLRWVKAGDLSVGDKIIGFEEKKAPNTSCRENKKWIGVNGKNRKIIPTKVTSFSIEEKPSVEVSFSNGDKIITTRDHYWLGQAEKDNNLRWYKSENLRVGQRIKKYFNVWKDDKSYEAGWLSGFISGEGSVSQNYGFVIQFCQRYGETWNQALNYCKKLGIKLLKGNPKRKTGGLGKQDTLYTAITGGKFKQAEIMGKLKIKRLINKLDWTKFGGLSGRFLEENKVIRVKDVGLKKVAVFSTDSKTFFGAGYAMHNCNNFDRKKANTRFLKYGLGHPAPYQTIDTLLVARREFKVSSNKLDYLCKFLGLDVKLPTGFQLWKDCLNGDAKALAKMDTYCQNDVKILEELYLILRPYIHSHPNLSLYMDTDKLVCPNCGSSKLKWGYKYTTLTNQYKSARCECGAFVRTSGKGCRSLPK